MKAAGSAIRCFHPHTGPATQTGFSLRQQCPADAGSHYLLASPWVLCSSLTYLLSDQQLISVDAQSPTRFNAFILNPGAPSASPLCSDPCVLVYGFEPIYHSTSILLELLAIISRMHLSFYAFIAPVEQDAHLGIQALQWRPTIALPNACDVYDGPRMTKASTGRRLT